MSNIFGYDTPLRASAIPSLLRCPWRSTLLHLGIYSDDSGAAAQTGSLIHRGVEVFHRTKTIGAALDAMSSALAEFPLADEKDAQRHVAAYAADPRNRDAEIVAIEARIEIKLPPWHDDHTGCPIIIHGTLDQVRLVDGVRRVYDLKTGKRPGVEMLNDYAHQFAAYCVGADAEPGGVIRSQGYFRRPPVNPADAPEGVFFEFPFGLAECRILLDDVRREVAAIRRGECAIRPGGHCSYCPAGGLGGCLSDARRLSA